jgi:hypothetical protein
LVYDTAQMYAVSEGTHGTPQNARLENSLGRLGGKSVQLVDNGISTTSKVEVSSRGSDTNIEVLEGGTTAVA